MKQIDECMYKSINKNKKIKRFFDFDFESLTSEPFQIIEISEAQFPPTFPNTEVLENVIYCVNLCQNSFRWQLICAFGWS